MAIICHDGAVMRLHLLLLPLLLIPCVTQAGTPTLDPVVIVARRVAEPLSQVVASVSQVGRDELERHLVRDLEGLTRYVAGVGVVSDANRFGALGFSIRGLAGNRVRVLIDDVPLSDAYSIGQFASAGRDLVDLETLERVEILRGPASTLYGSDALAGVVAYTTRDPDDLLAHAGRDRHVGLRLGHDGTDDSYLTTASLAGQDGSGRWQGMAVVGQRRGDETGNRAWRDKDQANPADTLRESLLAKLVFDAGAAGRYRLTADSSRATRESSVNSLLFGAGRFATTYRLEADDRQQRDRVSLTGHWEPARRWLDSLEALVYVQDTSIRQDTDQYRLPDAATPFESLRWRRFEYDADATGLGLLGQVRHDGRLGGHWHLLGLDLTRQRYRGLRDGLETNLATGATRSVILGEALPVRDFPHTDADSLSLYWQDEIQLSPRFAVIPGVRAEWYRLRAHPDAIFREDFPDTAPVDLDEEQVTPRLAVRWTLDGGHSLFAQYARGFRAPPFGDVNIGLLLPVFNYEVRANPDLKPERSQGLELGWRHVSESLRASVSLYENRYRDLIESRANLGIDPATGTLVFQSVNRDRARIRGIEADLLWRLDTLHERLDGWQLRAAGAWSEGDDQRRHRPLNSIDPPQATLGLRFDSGSGHWGMETAMTTVKGKSRIDHDAGELFAPPGYVKVDLYAWAEPRPGLRINVGLLNLTDRRYWDWAGVRGVAAGNANAGFYTRPGRSLALGVSFDW